MFAAFNLIRNSHVTPLCLPLANIYIWSGTSGFRRGVVGSWLPTFRDNVSFPRTRVRLSIKYPKTYIVQHRRTVKIFTFRMEPVSGVPRGGKVVRMGLLWLHAIGVVLMTQCMTMLTSRRVEHCICRQHNDSSDTTANLQTTQ